jgi:pilus assembly protein Flp/PilA
VGPPSYTAYAPSALAFGLSILDSSSWRHRNMFQVLIIRQRDEDGQGLAEYALILALIAIVAIAALVFMGTSISGLLSTVASYL